MTCQLTSNAMGGVHYWLMVGNRLYPVVVIDTYGKLIFWCFRLLPVVLARFVGELLERGVC